MIVQSHVGTLISLSFKGSEGVKPTKIASYLLHKGC
ncbi:hypothetical protein MXB_5707 [Myxobolus squamalis]|nr:hypothetical protein MXB_5707 [Myxobolus squamalis]